ncbi:MAG: D-alanyl-D-alanine carboxypeptidase/D-alanyl-D-alanine-endopeptidase, partial [Bacteroidota bacterium]
MVTRFDKFALLFLLPVVFSAQINNVIENWEADKDLKSATLSFCVLDAKSGEVVSELNSHQYVIPASTLKVITTGAALGTLGPTFRYSTKIFYTGSFNKETGVINGDLIIYGNGDPTLQSENFSKDTNQVTDKWAQALKEKGIKEIKGKIIGDASYFDRTIPGNWIWADISNYFGVAPCGLSYNDNKFKILYTSKEAGSKANVDKIIPAYCNNTICINSNVISKGTEDDAFVFGDPYSYIKEVRGKIPPNKTNFEVEAALPDPALLCAEKLSTSLTRIGIKCNQKSVESNYKQTDSVVTKQLIYSHLSPSLDKIIYYTNLSSINLYCESLVKTLGKGNSAKGIERIKKHFSERGLDTDQLYMV